jgi:DNA-binding transcriptional MocR family regulator
MQTTLRALKTYINFKGVSWIEPTGGFLLWLTLENAPISEEELHRIFLQFRVSIAPGRMFFSEEQDTKRFNFRLSISTLDEVEIEEGIKRLGEALSFVYDTK